MLEQVRKPAHNGETEAESLLVSTGRPDLMKFRKNGFLLVFADTNARVLDLNTALAITLHALQFHFALVRVTDRIANEILNNLAEQIRIGTDHCITGLRREIQAFVVRLARELRREPVNQTLHRKFL